MISVIGAELNDNIESMISQTVTLNPDPLPQALPTVRSSEPPLHHVPDFWLNS